MKGNRVLTYLALLCLFIALFIPLTASADDCSPENPNCKMEPPQSIEVNANPLQADGSPVELEEPGALSPQLIPMPLPRRVDPLPLDNTPSFETLAIDMRYQDPGDVSCGVQALGMAMSGLSVDAPTSEAILAFLEDSGMMYDFGTGVEELAYAAQSLGYKGSVPFHDWTLEDLQAELSAARPVVVSLGTNGEANAGHFVTVTGISGGQVAYNDPTLGKQVVSTEEFLRLWSLQGNSGVAVRREAPAGDAAGLAAWVAASAAAMALISQTPNALRRKGIGGRLDVGGAAAGRGPAPAGYRWVQRQTPKYEWRTVQEGWNIVPKTVPKMVRTYKRIGWTTTTQRIPRYKTVQVQDGWTYTYQRVPTYRTERYVRSWRTQTTRQATYRYVGGRRIFAGYRTVTRRVPVYGTRRVFAGYRTERKRVPRMVERRVLAGYSLVEKRVPKYGWVEEQAGWTVTTERIPRMVRKQVQVGTETRWTLERVPTPAPPRRPPTTTATSSPIGKVATSAGAGWVGGIFAEGIPRVLQTGRQFADNLAPTLRGFIHEELWRTNHNANPVNLLRSGWAWLNPAKNAKDWDGGLSSIRKDTLVQLKSTDPNMQSYSHTVRKLGRLGSNLEDDGVLLVTSEAADDVVAASANPSKVGSSGVACSEADDLAGLARNAAKGSRMSLLRTSVSMANKAAVKGGAIGGLVSGLFSGVGNTIDYAEGRISLPTAVAGTAVDTVGGIASAAAGAWTGAMAGAAIGTVVPGIGNIVGGIAGFVVGFAVSFGVQHLWDRYVKQPVTEFISNGISAWSGVVQNGLVIAQTAANRVAEGVRQTVDKAATVVREVAGSVTNTVATAARTVSNAVTTAADAVSDAVATAANAVSDAVGTAANAVSNAVSSVASFFGIGGG